MSESKAVLEITAHNESETLSLAAALAEQCRIGDCLLLRGDLGAGKTAFARGFIQALGGGEEVVSPTFTLVQTYRAKSVPVWHFDLYRLKNPQELTEIGLEEGLISGITLIEWPELAQSQLPEDALTITITGNTHPNARIIRFSGASPAWESRLAATREAMHGK